MEKVLIVTTWDTGGNGPSGVQNKGLHIRNANKQIVDTWQGIN